MCFFFQAEDGIRDDLVTGVQTCALPISLHTRIEFKGHWSSVESQKIHLQHRSESWELRQSLDKALTSRNSHRAQAIQYLKQNLLFIIIYYLFYISQHRKISILVNEFMIFNTMRYKFHDASPNDPIYFCIFDTKLYFYISYQSTQTILWFKSI